MSLKLLYIKMSAFCMIKICLYVIGAMSVVLSI